MQRQRHRLAFGAAATAGAALTAIAAWIVSDSPWANEAGLAAVGRSLVIAVPVAVGLWAWHTRPDERFGPLLVGAGFAWFFITLAESDNDIVYSSGRVAVWLVEPVLIYLVLAFPAGRITDLWARRTMAFSIAMVALLFVPTAFLVESYPLPSPYTLCNEGCPPNAFMLTSTQPGFTTEVIQPVREIIAALVFAFVIYLLARRLSGSTRLMRKALAPVLAIAIFRAALFVAYIPLRRVAEGTTGMEVLGWIYVLTLPAMAIAFFVGLLRARLFAGEALQRLALRLRERPGPEEAQRLVREATEDPTLELRFAVPDATPGRTVTVISGDDGPIAAAVHDPALADQRAFVRAAASLALAGLENRQLAAQVDESMEELRESRTRIQAAADNERRRIERDLHDGAQQRLVALRIRLGLAADVAKTDPERSAALLDELGTEAEEALEELRSLAHGVYPSLLADRGLEEALTALGRSAPLRRHRGRAGSRPLPARDRERRLLLLPRGSSEHAQARERVIPADRGHGGRRLALHGRRRRCRLRRRHGRRRRRVHEHARPRRGRRR